MVSIEIHLLNVSKIQFVLNYTFHYYKCIQGLYIHAYTKSQKHYIYHIAATGEL